MTLSIQLEEDFIRSSCYAVYGGEEDEKNYSGNYNFTFGCFERMW